MKMGNYDSAQRIFQGLTALEPKIAKLLETYADKGVVVLGVYANPDEIGAAPSAKQVAALRAHFAEPAKADSKKAIPKISVVQ